MDLQTQFRDFKKQTQQKEEDIKKGGDLYKTILEKNQLEQTLMTLSEEVEVMSKQNERLLKDLQRKDFYQQYYEISNEVKS